MILLKTHPLLELLDKTSDKKSFLIFINALRSDFIDNREQWENWTIDDFLESIGRWVEDYQGDDIRFLKPDWKTFAAMLYMGKLYE